MDESRKRVIAIVAGILVEKQFLEEDFRQNGISPRAQFCPFQRLTLARAHPAACGWRLRKQLKWTLGVANMKHKFTGEICVYCNKAPSETKDHTVGRKFFLEEGADCHRFRRVETATTRRQQQNLIDDGVAVRREER